MTHLKCRYEANGPTTPEQSSREPPPSLRSFLRFLRARARRLPTKRAEGAARHYDEMFGDADKFQ